MVVLVSLGQSSKAFGCRPEGGRIMINTLSRPKSSSRRAVLILAAVAVTLAFLGLALWVRLIAPEAIPLTWDDLTAFEINPYVFGYLFQSVIVPALLIYLLSATALFRRAVSGEARAGDAPKLFGALALIQVLVQTYDLARMLGGGEPGPAVLGLLVIVTGGLLGGWPLGLGLGLIAWLFRGSQELALLLGQGLGAELQMIHGAEGLGAVLAWPEWLNVLRWPFLHNFWAVSAVWAGTIAGLVAEALGERRFSPLAALGLGAGIDLGAGLLMTLAGMWGVVFLAPSMLLSGVAMAAVALMVRNVLAATEHRKAEAAELARARADLRALRAQINPHFLFNSLNTIRYFVRTDPEAARRLLLSLSEVFQRALRSGEFVTLKDELSYVEAYLALEQARLDERLQVEWLLPRGRGGQVALPQDQPVPTLILQPIVENAVVHGVAKRTGGGWVRVKAGLRNGDLFLEVEDNGPGIPPKRLAQVLDPKQASGGSIGLRNVDGRLRALYGDDYRLAIKSQVGEGTRVLIRIPLAGPGGSSQEAGRRSQS